jgi:hypothetical protein
MSDSSLFLATSTIVPSYVAAAGVYSIHHCTFLALSSWKNATSTQHLSCSLQLLHTTSTKNLSCSLQLEHTTSLHPPSSSPALCSCCIQHPLSSSPRM